MNGTALAYFVHGRGRGHAARAREIVPRLRAGGYRVDLYAGDDALPWLQPLGEVHPITVVRPGAAGPAAWASRVRNDLQALAARPAQLLVTDGDGPCLVAARRLGLPAVAVGHGLIFGNARLPRLPRRMLLAERVNAASAGLLAQRRVAVHFLPAEASNAATTIARPDFAPGFVGQPPADYALAYFRDDDGDALLDALAAQRRGTGIETLHCFTRRTPAALPAIDGVRFLPLDPDAFRAQLPAARAVLGSAGSNLLAECVHLARPLFCQYGRGDREQAMNAQLATDAGVAVSLAAGDAPGRAVAAFSSRLRSGGFAQVPLADALPPASEAVARAVLVELEARRSAGR